MTEKQPHFALSTTSASRSNFLYLPRPTVTYSQMRGAAAIAKYVLGANDRASVRAMFNILATSSTIPATKEGGIWCLDIGVLNAKLWSQQRRSFPTPLEEQLGQLHLVLSALQPLLAVCGVRTEHGDVAPGDYVATALSLINELLHSKKP
jgi:hypothetical protein